MSKKSKKTQPQTAVATALQAASGVTPTATATGETSATTKPLEAAKAEAEFIADSDGFGTATDFAARASELESAEAAVTSAKAALTAARAHLASLKKGPIGPTTGEDGQPLTAGKKAWLTRVARGTAPQAKPKEPNPPLDPNAPNLTAGQKAWLTRQARLADPNYKPEKKAAPKANAAERMETAVDAAFPPGAGEQYGNGTRVALS